MYIICSISCRQQEAVMARESYDPFKDETIHHRKPRKKPVTVDWKLAARRVAEGAALAAVAAELGITEEHFWRHLRRSLRFRFLLEQAVERRAGLIALQSRVALPAAVLDRCLQAESLDGSLLSALVSDTQAGRASGGPAGDSSGLIDLLAETGRRPPNMAFRRRIAAERRQMDAAVAVIKAQAGFLRPATAADPARTAANPNEPERTQTNLNEPERTQTNLNEPERTQTDLNEPERSETNPNGPERSETNCREPERSQTARTQTMRDDAKQATPDRVRPAPAPYDPWPGRPPRHLVPKPPEPRSRAALYGTIVDLEGPDLARIRAMGGFDPPEPDADGPADG
ncbi:MAG: hypothetical protein ACK4FK_06800 [Ferrovibrio sp.]|uniref:hypothetical protein n=1 Tax=Ferrovibrio sp. TaxID=1917215 RepID=UPI00391C3FAC